jgi:hypothetical protein
MQTLSQSKSGTGKLRGGAEEIIITPPAGAPTLGTIQRSTGVHDDLYARALVLSDGRQEIAILSLDLIGMPFELADKIRDVISKRVGISTTLVHCTHNHSAPFTIPWSVLGFRWLSGLGKTWCDGLVTNLAELVAVAKTKTEPVTLRAGRAPVRIGTNRRLLSNHGIVMKPNPTGAVVPWVDVLCVHRLDESLAAILFSHAAHPVIIHGSSRCISSEFPGFAVRKLKERMKDNVIALFGQAFAGNINADPLRGGIDAAEQAGEVLARAALEAAANSEPLPSHDFCVRSAHCELPLQPLPSEKECRQALHEAQQLLLKHHGRTQFSDEELWDMQDQVRAAASQSESNAENDVQPMEGKAWWMVDTVLCLQDLLNKVEHGGDDSLRFDAHLLRIGNHWSLLAATHELFAEYQLTLDSAVPTTHNMMLAYTNGCESYVPMERDLALGGYEAASFPAEGAALRYRHRRALRAGFEGQVFETLRSLWT